ncbi:MAG: beta-galactosidase [Armatimonadota bacterium]
MNAYTRTGCHIISAFLMGVSLLTAAVQLKAAPETTIIDNLNTLRAWGTRRETPRMAAEYAEWQMSLDPDGHTGSCMKLDFVPKVGGADVWAYDTVDAPVASLGAWVQNVSRSKVSLSLNLVESDGSIYNIPSVPLATDGEWHYVSFPMEKCTVAPWSKDDDGVLNFPTAQIIVVLSDYPIGQRVTVKIDTVSAVSPDLKPVDLVAVSVPKTAKPGQSISVSLKIKPFDPVTKPCELRLVRQGTVVSRVKLDPSKWVQGRTNALGPVKMHLPDRLWPGKHDMVLYMPMYRLKGCQKNIIGSVNVAARPTIKQSYTVRTHNGTPQIFEGSKPLPMMGYMYEFDNRSQVRLFGNADVHLYWLETRQMGWVGNNEYDYTLTDTMLAELFEDDPQARVIPWFYVDLAAAMVTSDGDWWQKQHPEELCQDINGKVFERYDHQTVSFASEPWRKDAGEAMAKFIRHLEGSPYADRIVGYQPCAGGSYEWMYHGGQDSLFLDYSKPTQHKFRQWLKQRYGTDAKLQSAWGDTTTSLAAAAIPTPEQRLKADNGSLRDPKTEQPVIDYTEFMSHLTSDTIDYFCGIIKRETNRHKLAGVFYGYVMEQFYGGYSTQHTGHFDLAGILKSQNVDYLMSPTSYQNRQAGGTGGYMSAIASLRLHNKLWIDQADIRTHLTDAGAGFGRNETEQQTVGVLRREWAMYTAAGSPVYWYCFSLPWYIGSKQLMPDIKKMASLTIDAQNTPSALDGNRLAVIVSDSAAAYSSLLTEPLRSSVYLQREALHRSGVPFDVYLDSDLGNPKMPKYKAYLFLDSLHLAQSTRAWIEANLKSDGRVLAWVWAPGIAIDTLDVKNSSALTGIKLKLSKASGVVTVTPEAGSGEPYGSEGTFSPIILPDDPRAQLIGQLTSPAELAGQPGAVTMRYTNWNSVYSAAPHLNPAMIRGIAKLAGVPVYSEDDQPIYIGPNTIGLHGSSTAERTVVLPKAARVTDAFTGAVIGDGVTQFKVKVNQYDTELILITR